MPTESLSTIAFLLHHVDSQSPLQSHLSSLVQRRTHHLLGLQSALHTLAQTRDELYGLTLSYANTVEDSLAEDARADRNSAKLRATLAAKVVDKEGAVIDCFENALDDFEDDWTAGMDAFDVWDGAFEPETWLDGVEASVEEAQSTVQDFLELLLADPATLGAGIATLESLTELLPSAKPSHPAISSPLATLFHLYAAASGPETVLTLAQGLWETAIRELVGRESSRNAQLPGNANPGLGARERELEVFLVGMLELLDSMGLYVQLAESATSQQEEGAVKVSSGPLAMNRAVEDILLQLLHDAQQLPKTQVSPAPDAPRPEHSSSFSPFGFGSAVVNTLSTSSSYLTSGLYNVATLSGTGLSSVGVGLGLKAAPPMSPTLSTASSSSIETPTTPPPLHRARPSLASSTSSTPSLPSRIPASLSWSPRAYLLTSCATSLLKTLTPSSGPSSRSTPLVERLIAQLLGSSFPFSTTTTTQGPSSDAMAHRKVLLLAVVRWWAFARLAKLGRAGSGGAYVSSSLPAGVRLSSPKNEMEEEGKWGPRPQCSTALLDEVYVSPEVGMELFLGVHKTIYGAIVAACGFASASEWDEKADASGVQERRALKKAAKTLVHAWSAPCVSPEETTSPIQKDIAAFSIDQDEFVSLVRQFSPLVLHGLAAGPASPRFGSPAANGYFASPSLARSFKRSRAFNSSSSTMAANHGENAGLQIPPSSSSIILSESDRSGWTLGERLEAISGDLARGNKGGPAVFFASSRGEDEQRRVRVDTSLSAFGPQQKERNGWSSPPRSPRDEAVMGNLKQGSYFTQRSVSPFPVRSPDTPIGLQRSQLASSPPSSTPYLNGKRGTAPSEIKPPKPTPAEVTLLRKAIFALARQGWGSRPASHPPKEEDVFTSGSASFLLSDATSHLFAALERAIRSAAQEKDYSSQILFSQTKAILLSYRNVPGASQDLSSVIDRIAAPLRETFEAGEAVQRVARRQLVDLEVQRGQLLDAARLERSALDDLRVRAWYSSIKGGVHGVNLRRKLEAGLTTSGAEAERKVDEWAKERGIFSFTKAVDFEEPIMHVEQAAAEIMAPSHFYGSLFWRREQQVVDGLFAAAGSREMSEPSFAETLFQGGSTLFSVIPSTLGVGGTSPTMPPALTSSLSDSVILSFGAAPPSLLKARESKVALMSAVEEQHLRVAKRLSGYIWSDYSTLIDFRDVDNRLFGCDSWFEEFASPLSPLPRPSPDETKSGSIVPKAYLPSGPAPPAFVRDLLLRFTHHPSPHVKLHTVLELEMVLSSMLTAPPSALAARAAMFPAASASSLPSPSHPKQLHKLVSMLSKRLSLAPSPTSIAKLLEQDADDLTDLSHLKEASCFSAPEGFAPRARQYSVASNPLSIPEDSSFDPSIPDDTSHLDRLNEASTDDVLAELENIVRHVRPSALFQNLQIVGALTPPRALEQILGKAFWDLSLAALSVKRDIVEGEHGVVERALTALADGTEDSRELAERLIAIGVTEESLAALDAQRMLGVS